MIQLRFYTIVINRDSISEEFKNFFTSYKSPKNIDDNLMVFYTMQEGDIPIIEEDLKSFGLVGIDKQSGKWRDYAIIGSMQGLMHGGCDWLKITDNHHVEFIG